MPTLYQTPGVYIQEVTGPGVIQGVGTSTAVFIGPTVVGPIGQPIFVTTFDDYKRSFGTLPNGNPALYIASPRRFYLTDAISGFFQNGGTQAYVYRVGTGMQATWAVTNQAATPETVFLVQALALGSAGNGLTVATAASNMVTNLALAAGSAKVATIDATSTVLTVDDASTFAPGDIVTVDQSATAVVAKSDTVNKVITLQAPLAGLVATNTLVHADITPLTTTVRLGKTSDATKLFVGSVVKIAGVDASNKPATDYAVIQAINASLGVLTLAPSPKRTATFRPGATAPTLTSQEFNLTITPTVGSAEVFSNLSLSGNHPNYVGSAVSSGLVQIMPPPLPAVTNTYPAALVNAQSPVPVAVMGADDAPGNLTVADYQAALDQLKDLEGVNIVCIPDASSHPSDAIAIQLAMIAHCTDPSTLDRVAVLDSQPGLPPGPGPGSVLAQRQQLDSPSGYAAIYYPWLTVPDLSTPPNASGQVNVPPCGHIAGIYARVDATVGVHKAPANVEVAGVLGLERIISDRQQGPLNNPGGVNVLRIFPGSGAVNVWGARTTVNMQVQGTDWVYVSTRRLLIFIEQSLKQALRPSVFEPNNPSLWGALTREIDEFLTRVWQTGALFGDKAAQAFYVRIDEGNNPPSLQALGQLNIEIGVRPSYPAEFIIVTIGLWDGGAQVSEN
jgi:uncharacterized protein